MNTTLSDKDLLFVYKEIILFVETLEEESAKNYNIRKTRQYLANSGINVLLKGGLKVIEPPDFSITGNYVLFTKSKKNQILSLFAHLRNAFAHGRFRVEKNKGSYTIILTDRYYSRITMYGQLYLKDLRSFIQAIKIL